MEESVRTYLDSVSAVCADVLAENLTAVWFVGSLATGDFDIRCSDIDVLVTAASSVSREAKEALGRRLSHSALRCPAHGVDLLVYRAAELTGLRREPRFEFSISSGVEWTDDIDLGGPYPGGIIDLAMAREIGGTVLGPGPREVVGWCPAEWIVEELMKGIRWHGSRIHDPFHDPTGSNAVLNACRALYFVSCGAFASKSGGARWLLATRPIPVVADALAAREAGNTDVRLDRAAILAFLHAVTSELDADS